MAETTQNNVKALVNKMPDLDVPRGDDRRDEGKLTGPAWPEAQKTYDTILSAGRDGVLALVNLLSEDTLNDYKAPYTLHGLVVYVSRPEKQAERRLVVDVLASELASDRPTAVRAFLVRELQWIADASAAPALGKLLLDEQLYADAASALLAIGQDAVEQFRKALPAATGRIRLTILQALGILRDQASAGTFRAALADADREIRITAGWALANLGDPASVDALLKAADTEGWERIQQTKACLILAERLVAAWQKSAARRVYEHLRSTRTDQKEAYVRELAENAIASLQ